MRVISVRVFMIYFI